jgi:site-specific recombinase XerD
MATAASPANLYLANLSAGSQGMRQPLDVIAGILDGKEGQGHDADSCPWHELTYRDTMTVRTALAERYRPATVNKMLSALRGVLKQAWRLGLMDAEAYRRAADVENVRSSNLLSGRALPGDEIARLFGTCTADPTPKGTRDAAILAVFYGGGLRRGELVRLDIPDFDPADCSIRVHGKGRKQRTVYLSAQACAHVQAWLRLRDTAAGPLFVSIDQTGQLGRTRLRGESIAYILRRRQQQAGIDPFSPHDLRRSFVTTLLDAGEDVFTVQKLAGHADASTTARYDRRGEGAKRRAVNALTIPDHAG